MDPERVLDGHPHEGVWCICKPREGFRYKSVHTTSKRTIDL